jgi:cytochrome c nitrite reductase small subunit
MLTQTPTVLLVATLAGVLGGLGAFTFSYGVEIFSTDPKACANCHVMNDQYASWAKGPHQHCHAAVSPT